MIASIFFISDGSSFFPGVPGPGQADARNHGGQWGAHREHDVSHHQGASGKQSPSHFVTTIIRLNTTTMATRTMTGIFSDLVHAGFCVPSWISLRISWSCFRASDNSPPL